MTRHCLGYPFCGTNHCVLKKQNVSVVNLNLELKECSQNDSLDEREAQPDILVVTRELLHRKEEERRSSSERKREAEIRKGE